MKYAGIIFDLDGVICSTDEYHYQAWKALSDRLGIPFDRERNNLLRGVSRMESLNIVLEKSAVAYSEEEKAAMATEKNDAYRQLLHQMSPADLSGEVKATLDALRAQGLKLAINGQTGRVAVKVKQQIKTRPWYIEPALYTALGTAAFYALLLGFGVQEALLWLLF